MKLARIIYRCEEIIRKIPYKIFREPIIKAAFHSCGKNVHIAEKCNFMGIENISIGDGSSIGRGSLLWTTCANISIGKKVFTGPNVTIITGNHRVNFVGKYMADISVDEKNPWDDQDVVIHDDVWIGANVTILKGVTIGEGCVIAAGAVVTKSMAPYGIYAGVPAKQIGSRFSLQELEQHKQLLSCC